MFRILRFNLLSTCLIALFTMTVPLAAQSPSLSGTVDKTSGGTISQAKVELLTPGTDDVRHHGYTDSHGRYALWNVPAGRYELRVKFGTQILTQIIETGQQELAQRRTVELGNEPQQLIVRVRG